MILLIFNKTWLIWAAWKLNIWAHLRNKCVMASSNGGWVGQYKTILCGYVRHIFSFVSNIGKPLSMSCFVISNTNHMDQLNNCLQYSLARSNRRFGKDIFRLILWNHLDFHHVISYIKTGIHIPNSFPVTLFWMFDDNTKQILQEMCAKKFKF